MKNFLSIMAKSIAIGLISLAFAPIIGIGSLLLGMIFLGFVLWEAADGGEVSE